jgi:HlyD family secretion protein
MAHAEQKRSSSALLWVLGLALLIGAVFFIRSLTEQPTPVRVAPASYQTLSSEVSTNGRVEPVEEYQAHAPAPGVVRKIYVSEGDHVTPGELLFRMDDADMRSHLTAAQASLSQAELQLAQLKSGGTTEELGQFKSNASSARMEEQAAEQNLRAVEALQQKGSASASEVAAAQQRLRTAQNGVAIAGSRSVGRYDTGEIRNAEARVIDARASVDAARAALSEVDQRSPISGTVYSIPVSETDFVHEGDDLMDIADLNRIQIRAYFDEPDIGKLAVGQPVTIDWGAKPNQQWHGHVVHVPTTIITYGTSRNVGECLITVDDAHGDLPPNSNVTVTVTEVKRADVLSIPHEALHTDGARNYVFRIVNGRLQQTPVKITSLITVMRVEIADGLKAGDMVVLGPANPGTELTNGMQVKPVK